MVTMVTQGFLWDSPVFPAGSSLMRCSHINLILSMFHQFGHIRFLIYVYLHTKQHFMIFYVFVAICFGSSPFFKQIAWTIKVYRASILFVLPVWIKSFKSLWKIVKNLSVQNVRPCFQWRRGEHRDCQQTSPCRTWLNWSFTRKFHLKKTLTWNQRKV